MIHPTGRASARSAAQRRSRWGRFSHPNSHKQPEKDIPIRVDVFALVRWAPEDLIRKGKMLILYQGEVPIAEVLVDN